MTIEETIRFTKQALENVNPDKRVCTEFRFTVEQVKQLLEWLEEYKRLKYEMIPAYDEAEIDEVIAEIQRCTDLSTPGFVIRSAETLRDEIAMLKDYKRLKADYADLGNRLRTANTENDELKRLLRLAVDDLDTAIKSCEQDMLCEICSYHEKCNYINYCGGEYDRTWKHRDEAMKLLGGAGNAEN